MSLSLLTHSSTLPILTTLIGTGGLTVGIYSFINPIAAARIYGVPVQISGPTLTDVLASTSSAASSTSDLPPQATQTGDDNDSSYIHALGIRNLTTGLTILSLTAYWHFTLVSANPEIRLAVQRALGIVILAGSLVPVADAWMCWAASRNAAEDQAATQCSHGRKQIERRPGHPGKGGAEQEAVEVGRKAGNLHAMRSLVWIGGAVWCFLG